MGETTGMDENPAAAAGNVSVDIFASVPNRKQRG